MKSLQLIKILVIAVLVFCTQSTIYAQVNSQCGNATPFCTGIPMQLPAATNAPPAQAGPCYGCLGSEPNPAWFFLQMSSSGPVSIAMSANSDIDFIMWGPFPSLAGVCGQLCGNIQSCSYSASNTETATIANAVAGSFYVLLITNFSNQVQQINFNQVNTNPGSGTTNCGVICGITLNNSGKICSGQSNTLTATTNTSISSYTLNGPTGVIASGTLAATSNTFSNIVPTVSATTSFTLKASNSTSSCQAVSTVSVLQYPTFSISPTATPAICQGGQLTAGVSFTGTNNQAPYSYNWSGNIASGSFATPSPGPGIFNPGNQQTIISPSSITGSIATVMYSVTVSPSALYCPTTHTMLLTINNPFTPTLNIPPTICNTSTVLLTATPGGGTWSANPAVFSNGLFTAASATVFGDNTVKYTVSAGNCNVSNTGTISVSKYNTAGLIVSSVNTLCVNDQPFDLMNIVQSTVAGTWSGPFSSNYVVNNTFVPSLLSTGTYSAIYNTTSTPIASVCPASSTIVLSVFNPPTPVIGGILPFCNNGAPVQLNAIPSGGLWSSQGVAALTGVLTPTAYAIGGVYSVSYSAGQGTCTASSSRTFEVSEFRTAALTGPVPDMCITNNPFNLMSIVSDNHGTWSAPNNVSGNTFNPTSPSSLLTGTYVLTYNNPSFPDPTLCPQTSTIAVSLLNPVTPYITQVGPFCNVGGTVQLNVTPATGSWVPSSYLSVNGVFTPSLSPVGNNMVQYVIGTNTCNVQQTTSISVEGFVTAGLTGTVSDQCTTNSPLNLLPYTLSNLGTWTGPGIIGSSFNPLLSGTGNITLTYNTASSPSGLCPDQSTVAVSVYSLALPIFSAVKPMCTSAAPVKLIVSPVGGIFGGANNDAVTRQGIFVPASAVVGSNIINYSITAGPCIAYAAATVTIEKFISADFTTTAGPYCKNDPKKVLNLNNLVKNPDGEWGGPGVSGNLFTFANANMSNNNVINYMTHSMPTASLCPDTKSISIHVYDVPVVSALSDKYQGCAPVEVKLNSPEFSGASGIGTWDFGDGSEPESNTTLKHKYTSPGTYTVVYTYSVMVTVDFGCVAQAVVPMPVKVFETPQPDFTFGPEEVMISEPTVQFNNVSASVERNRYQWTISGTELNQTLLEVQPSVMFPHVGDYKVTLTATNLNGCKNEVSKIVSVKSEFNIFVPSSFSPNDDNTNDFFFPVFSEYGLDDKTFEMQIFDRWGNLLFQTKDKTQKWDGKKSGQPLKQDVYVYKIKYKDVAGNVYNKTGYVSIIR